MRKPLLLAVSVVVIFGASLLAGRVDAMIVDGTGARIAADQMRTTEPAARVCRKYCNDEGGCRERCQTVRGGGGGPADRARERGREGRGGREGDRDRDRERERDRDRPPPRED